jgi:uncharacterized protein (TIGR02118 family)
MYKLTILFRPPANLSKFEDEWAHTFLPFAEAMPGILRIAVSTFDGGPDGPAEFYKSHEFYFENRAAMDKAMNSEKGTRAGQALNTIAKDIFTIMFSDVLEDILRPGGQPPEVGETTHV